MAVNALAHISVPTTTTSGPKIAPSCEIACHCGLLPANSEHTPMPSAMPPSVVISDTHAVFAFPITVSHKPNAMSISGMSISRRPN